MMKKCHFIIDFPMADYSFFLLEVCCSSAKKKKKMKKRRTKSFRLRDFNIPDISFSFTSSPGFWKPWLNFTYHPESYRSINDDQVEESSVNPPWIGHRISGINIARECSSFFDGFQCKSLSWCGRRKKKKTRIKGLCNKSYNLIPNSVSFTYVQWEKKEE